MEGNGYYKKVNCKKGNSGKEEEGVRGNCQVNIVELASENEWK